SRRYGADAAAGGGWSADGNRRHRSRRARRREVLQLQRIRRVVSYSQSAVKLLYFDCFSGISGDMAIGALVDAGLPLEDLKRAFGSLAVPGVHVHAERVLRAGLSATKFTVHTHEHPHEHHHHDHVAPSSEQHHAHRSLPEIFDLIDSSALSPAGRNRAKALFQRLA